jgi:hypothetical protein
MEKVLNQEEIDAMVRLARAGGNLQAQMAVPPLVELWDVRLAGQIGRGQLQATSCTRVLPGILPTIPTIVRM